jgi:ankyrin repeat protein
MKSLKIALAGALLALTSAPALAQYYGSDGDQFVEAVAKRDGNKATELLQNHPTIIDTKNEKGDTPLLVVLRDEDSDWTGFLLNKGADVNAHGANGDTPLIAAAKAGFDDAAVWLLGMKADVDETNRSGETALIIAVQRGNARIVKLLLDHGANPDRTDAVAGYSARDYANRNSRAREIQKLIEDKKPKSASSANSLRPTTDRSAPIAAAPRGGRNGAAPPSAARGPGAGRPPA